MFEVMRQIKKSAGRMVVLMYRTGLPLRHYAGRGRVLYTLEPFGPRPGQLACLYDWERNTPIRFTERHVEKAVEAGLVAPHNLDTIVLTEVGHLLGPACCCVWEPEIDRYFAGTGVDWRILR